MDDIRNIVQALPELAGVYRYYDKQGKILYIGKAKNLKKRVTSYFNKSAQHSSRIKLLVIKIADIQHTVVNSERDALLLENALIKEHQPRYNIMLKDDKTYPFIKITNEHFPKVFFTRRYVKDGSEYYGPYTSLYHVRSLMELIKNLYPIRTCNLNLSPENIKKNNYRVCLEYHLGNCLGPCEGKQSEEDYLKNIDEIRSILKGKFSNVRKVLKEKMEQAAMDLQFEQAEDWKKKYLFIEEYMKSSSIVNPGLGNFHVFGYYEDNKKAYVNYLYVYDGTVIETKNTVIRRKLDETKEYLLEQAILDVILKTSHKEPILIPFPLEEVEYLTEYSFAVPKIGDKKKLLDLSLKNAFFIKKNEILKDTKVPKEQRILQIMKADLNLEQLPAYIECFDNSNIQGEFPVASMVVFRNARPSRSEYRHFNIKTVEGPDDYASMKEVVYRRYKRLLDEALPLPQLIVIDGGKGQLSVAIEVLKELGIDQSIHCIAIAEKLEEIYFPGDSYPLHISKKSESLKVIKHIRDEAHRFALAFHRNKRSKGTIKTVLTDIKGIGEKTAELLLQEIGSVKKIKSTDAATLEQLIGKKRTEQLLKGLSEMKL